LSPPFVVLVIACFFFEALPTSLEGVRRALAFHFSYPSMTTPPILVSAFPPHFLCLRKIVPPYETGASPPACLCDFRSFFLRALRIRLLFPPSPTNVDPQINKHPFPSHKLPPSLFFSILRSFSTRVSFFSSSFPHWSSLSCPTLSIASSNCPKLLAKNAVFRRVEFYSFLTLDSAPPLSS